MQYQKKVALNMTMLHFRLQLTFCLKIPFFQNILCDYRRKVFGNIISMKLHLEYVMKTHIMDTIKG